MKVRTSVLIEREILERAKELGLNLSQCFENCLKLYINALENANNTIISNQISQLENKHEKGKITRNRRCLVAGGVGFEPTITSLGGLRPILARLPAH